MTQNRFSVEDDADIWEDNHFLAVAYDHHNALKLAEKLNELANENKELKLKIQTQKQIIDKQKMKLAEYNNQKRRNYNE